MGILEKKKVSFYYALILDRLIETGYWTVVVGKFSKISPLNLPFSLSGFNTRPKNVMSTGVLLQQTRVITLKNCGRYSKRFPNGEMLSTFPITGLFKKRIYVVWNTTIVLLFRDVYIHHSYFTIYIVFATKSLPVPFNIVFKNSQFMVAILVIKSETFRVQFLALWIFKELSFTQNFWVNYIDSR